MLTQRSQSVPGTLALPQHTGLCEEAAPLRIPNFLCNRLWYQRTITASERKQKVYCSGTMELLSSGLVEDGTTSEKGLVANQRRTLCIVDKCCSVARINI